jgi:GNAT superfamily N-acetyltransferase
MNVRDADRSELDALAQLWHDGWRDAHAAISPPELTRLRTLDSFRERLDAALGDVRVAGALGSAPLGFHIVKADELYQIFVASAARGSGVAAALLADAEARLAGAGVEVAWLSCAIGNSRAERFYAKHGWRRVGTMLYDAVTAIGPFPLRVCRYEKDLRSAPPR